MEVYKLIEGFILIPIDQSQSTSMDVVKGQTLNQDKTKALFIDIQFATPDKPFNL